MSELSIKTELTKPAELATALLVVQVFERDREPIGTTAEIDEVFGGAIRRVLANGDFRGRKDERLLLYPSDPSCRIERLLLVGAGKREDFTAERLRRAIGNAVRHAEKLRVSALGLALGHTNQLSEHIGAFLAGRTAVEAAVLAAWDYRDLKTQPSEDDRQGTVTSITLLAFDDAAHREYERALPQGVAYGRAANFARDLQVRPGNVATPAYLAEQAGAIAEAHGMKITVLDRAAMQQEGMKALLAVAQGSEEEPRFIALEYRNGGDAKPLVLVGKGVTFDSGGISIKPAERMEEMKYDMSGAAAVLGAMQGIAELGLEVNVVALVPSTENLPSGRAVKPGDVIGSLLGKTIEVVNTDAEGRLILADALAYARRYEPAAVIDAATLTGAVVIGLGHHAIGIMGNDGDLMDEVRAAGLRVGERCWPLPLWDEYRSQIDSQVADIKNSGGRAAGTITAGWFLKEFAGETPWVHLDIAGTAWRDEAAPYLRKGATGVPTRLFIEWVRSRAEA
jgi:leucyl aminopeptidase